MRTHAAGGGASIVPPANLTATVTGSTVVLNWSAPAGPVTSYIIEAGSFSGYTDLAIFDTGSAITSIAVLNVPARIYLVRVRARNGADVSDPSNEITVTVAGSGCTATLYAPFAVHASGAGASVSLAWDVPLIGCPPVEYVIEAGSSRGAADLANFRTGSNQPRYDANGVGPGTYYVRVRSANELGLSYPSRERIMVIGSGCLYSITSSIGISYGGIPDFGEGLTLETGATCPWTMTTDAAWLSPSGTNRFPTSGQGPVQISMFVNVNASGASRSGTVFVRWPGGGADVAVSQNGRLY